MTAREALAAAFRLDPADVQAEDDLTANVERDGFSYSVYQDQQTSEWVASCYVLYYARRFQGMATGRTPDEALAGLVAPSPIPTPEPVEHGPWRVL